MCSPNSSGLPCPPLPAPRSTWMCWAPPTRWYRSRSRWVHLGGLCRAACCCTYHTSVRWPASCSLGLICPPALLSSPAVRWLPGCRQPEAGLGLQRGLQVHHREEGGHRGRLLMGLQGARDMDCLCGCLAIVVGVALAGMPAFIHRCKAGQAGHGTSGRCPHHPPLPLPLACRCPPSTRCSR